MLLLIKVKLDRVAGKVDSTTPVTPPLLLILFRPKALALGNNEILVGPIAIALTV